MKSRIVPVHGISHSVQEWAECIGISRQAFHDRLRRGNVGFVLLRPGGMASKPPKPLDAIPPRKVDGFIRNVSATHDLYRTAGHVRLQRIKGQQKGKS